MCRDLRSCSQAPGTSSVACSTRCMPEPVSKVEQQMCCCCTRCCYPVARCTAQRISICQVVGLSHLSHPCMCSWQIQLAKPAHFSTQHPCPCLKAAAWGSVSCLLDMPKGECSRLSCLTRIQDITHSDV